MCTLTLQAMDERKFAQLGQIKMMEGRLRQLELAFADELTALRPLLNRLQGSDLEELTG